MHRNEFIGHEQTNLTANQNQESCCNASAKIFAYTLIMPAAPVRAHMNIFKFLYKLLNLINLIEMLSLNYQRVAGVEGALTVI